MYRSEGLNAKKLLQGREKPLPLMVRKEFSGKIVIRLPYKKKYLKTIELTIIRGNRGKTQA